MSHYIPLHILIVSIFSLYSFFSSITHQFNEYYWNGFYGDFKVAIETLGWTVDSWDYSTSDPPATESKSWEELSNEERAAATLLCYFRETWDDVPITEYFDYEKEVNMVLSPDGSMLEDIDMSIFA